MNWRVRALVVPLIVLTVGVVASPAPHPANHSPFPQQPPPPLRFTFGGNAAEIPATFIDSLVFLPVHVNQSEPSLFELDSTAAVSSIDPDRAMEIGIGRTPVPLLNLSGVDISLGSLAETTKKDFGAYVGRPYEGTIGNDVLADAVVEIDYARQTVRLYDPATYQYSGRGKSFHLNLSSGEPVVQAKFSESGKMLDGSFAVDTALDASIVISGKFGQAHHLRFAHARTIPATDIELGEVQQPQFARIKQVSLGPYDIRDPIAVFSRGDSPSESKSRLAGRLGARLLRRFIVTFDYPHQRMILDPSSDFRADDLEDMSGLAIVATGSNLKTFEVTEVRSGTPGADAKIQKGDVIAGINDEAAADLSLAAIRNLLRQPGTKCKLLIQRNGQTLTVTLQTRRLI
ncbi:MAG TPA: PDZ domain-containing protein [Candidatus Acidoferrales bacterium]